ncbi:hypothetical protein M1D96_22420 [Pseudomonas sp. D1-3]
MNLERVIRDYVELQSSLLGAFNVSYPEASDYRWLLDFPKAGSIVVGNDVWVFKKHGAGLKFSRKTSEPCLVVDVHQAVDKGYLFDEWRVLQFLESYGHVMSLEKLKSEIALLSCNDGPFIRNGTLFSLRGEKGD